MEESPLYHQIADEIRRDILNGKLQPGDRLPSVRQLALKWDCTPGTIQRAYQDLSRQGLIVSRPGQGTRVVDRLPARDDTPMRRAALIHRAENFLLEVLTAGYDLPEVESAVQEAMERWRALAQAPAAHPEQTVRYAGSHDLAVNWLAAHFPEIAPGYSLQLQFTGSLGGLIALAENEADIAGSHLWDAESDSYNVPYVQRLLPGRRVAMVTLAHRRLGWILPQGNPSGIQNVEDIARVGACFVNRQPGSGTRVWLDAALQAAGIRPEEITGYEDERMTHSDVARAVAEGQADAGFGLEAAAHTYGLDFVLAVRERYDLVIPAEKIERPALSALVSWLGSETARRTFASVGGYDVQETGQVRWIGG